MRWRSPGTFSIRAMASFFISLRFASGCDASIESCSKHTAVPYVYVDFDHYKHKPGQTRACSARRAHKRKKERPTVASLQRDLQYSSASCTSQSASRAMAISQELMWWRLRYCDWTSVALV